MLRIPQASSRRSTNCTKKTITSLVMVFRWLESISASHTFIAVKRQGQKWLTQWTNTTITRNTGRSSNGLWSIYYWVDPKLYTDVELTVEVRFYIIKTANEGDRMQAAHSCRKTQVLWEIESGRIVSIATVARTMSDIIDLWRNLQVPQELIRGKSIKKTIE